MNVVIRYLAQLRPAAGTTGELVQLPAGQTVAGLLADLARRRPPLRDLLLDQAGMPRRSLLVFVGDRQVAAGQVLTEGDEVTLMTPIAGGGGQP